MKFESKFNLNQQAFYISKHSKSEIIVCHKCNGDGGAKLFDGTFVDCPKCCGKGKVNIFPESAWHVSSAVHIGKIMISIKSIKKTGVFDNIGDYDLDNAETGESMMCYETGIGTGSVYPAEEMFASKELAQAECDRLNEGEDAK